MTSLRRTVTGALRKVPGLGTAAVALKRRRESARFPGSAQYWESHYRQGGDSGPGSRGELAEYKAQFVNQFVVEHSVSTVVELGCGDGSQLALSNYPSYVGLDVAPTAIAACRMRFSEDNSKKFLVHGGEVRQDLLTLQAELALSMDVLFHLVEDQVFESYMNDLFQLATRFVIIYANDGPRDSTIASVTDRPFTGWVAEHCPRWNLQEHVRNEYPWNGDVKSSTLSEFYVYQFDSASQAP